MAWPSARIPGFPDLVGFGRREMSASPDEVEDMVLYQVAALAGVAAAAGRSPAACQSRTARSTTWPFADRELAEAIARGTAAFDRELILFGLPDSELLRAGAKAGLRVAAEVFADRAYEPDGSLASRTQAGERDSRQQPRSSRARFGWCGTGW